MIDYLVIAADMRSKIKNSIREKEFNTAWQLAQDLSNIYVEYINATNPGNTPEIHAWANGLVNSVSEYRAEILSKEGKHKDALYHATWKAVTEVRPIKKYKEKMLVYFRKAKLNITEEEFLKIFNEADMHKDAYILRQKIAALQ